MKKPILIVSIALALLLTTTAGGAAAWYTLRNRGDSGKEGEAHAAVPVVEKGPKKYTSLDKVVVMLRRNAGEPASHYLSMDLVFKSPDKTEKLTKEHLPMLRSVAVKALSSLTMEKASTMTIEQFGEVINTAYTETYKQDQIDKPFVEALIGKLIIE
jgi:flagellar FliL protein